MARRLEVAELLCSELSCRVSETPEEDPKTVLLALRGIRYCKLAGADTESLVALLRGRGNHQHAVLVDFLRGLNIEDIDQGIRHIELRLHPGSARSRLAS
ncbi:MAG: hypothetical protein R3231_03880 [bacterium]|nr:hypothetical protein [bacterium]